MAEVNISVGDKLIVVNVAPLEGNDKAPPLKLGEMKEAKSVHICSCGSKHIDVGLVSELNFVRCHECKEELHKGDQIHWCHPSRFILK
jgi:hypothetical protein